MVQVVTLLVSEGASVDVFTGRVTAFNLLDTIFAQKFPARVARLHVVVQYFRPLEVAEPHFFEKLELLDPDGVDVLSRPIQELTVTTRFQTSIHNGWNVVLSKGGDFTLRVSTSEKVEGPWTVQQSRIVVVDQAPHPLMPPAESPNP